MRVQPFQTLLVAASLAIFFAGCGVESDVALEIGGNTPAVNSNVTDNDSNSETDETSSLMHKPKSAPPSGYVFKAPVRLKAGDEYVSVEAPGYACPTMADVDGDGVEDLVVGQFNHGYMQFCKNVASIGETPKFADAEWIKTGDERAEVPGVW